ncbi:MAG: 30S ribosomal protein S8 [Rickettsiales bacterium]|jgi:small subunit ribosomal protein S8|nr:30S ribosomal protein S8 [Rickettsiales bacterium]
MSLSYPIGDLLARIRNGQRAYKPSVRAPYSKLAANVLDVMKAEGFITDFRKEDLGDNKFDVIVDLKYVAGGEGAIQELSLVSKPGRRVYSNVAKMPRVMNGLGVLIVSTPGGIMTDHQARMQNIGGEVICKIV